MALTGGGSSEPNKPKKSSAQACSHSDQPTTATQPERRMHRAAARKCLCLARHSKGGRHRRTTICLIVPLRARLLIQSEFLQLRGSDPLSPQSTGTTREIDRHHDGQCRASKKIAFVIFYFSNKTTTFKKRATKNCSANWGPIRRVQRATLYHCGVWTAFPGTSSPGTSFDGEHPHRNHNQEISKA